MLTKLQIKNFQVHRNLTIKFDSAVTTIVGPSDVGKSAVLRALRWVCLNKPDGSHFIHHGSDFSKVTVEVDGHKITRTRGKSNKYTLDGTSMVAFGRGNVPDPIESIINVGPENFQLQHEVPFWFGLSSGEVSRHLNAIVDLGVIDSSLTNAGRNVREAVAHSKAIHESLVEAREKKEKLKFVPKMIKDYDEIKKLEESVTEGAGELAQLGCLLQSGRKTAARREQALCVVTGVNQLLEKANTIRKTDRRLGVLHGLIAKIQEIQKKPKVLLLDFSELDRLHEEVVSGKKEMSRLHLKLAEIKKTQGKLCLIRKRLKKVKLTSLCPTCGTLLIPKM